MHNGQLTAWSTHPIRTIIGTISCAVGILTAVWMAWTVFAFATGTYLGSDAEAMRALIAVQGFVAAFAVLIGVGLLTAWDDTA